MSLKTELPQYCTGTAPLKLAKHIHSSRLDYFYILLFLLITVTIWRLPVYAADERLIPVFLHDEASILDGSNLNFHFPTELAFPWRPEPLSSVVCGAVVVLSPLVVFGSFQIKLRSVCDFHAAFSGVLKALVTTLVKHSCVSKEQSY